jgi:hypothetical protein
MSIYKPGLRVVGSDGKLHGYGGGDGLPTKEWLLKIEKAIIARPVARWKPGHISGL